MPSGTAIFHCDVSVTKRMNPTTGNRQSAVAASAYRAGENIRDLQTGEMHSYGGRKDVYSSTILTPKDAPDWAGERAELWNRHEEKETRKDAQLCRNVLLSLPFALDAETNEKMTLEWVQENFVSRGMVADVAFHDMDKTNPHAHIMLTMRHLEEEGFGNKNRAWNQYSPSMQVPKQYRDSEHETLADQWRSNWAGHVNAYLEQADIEARISHLPKSQQSDTEGFEGQYFPISAYHMEERGVETIAGEKKLEVDIRNQARQQKNNYDKQLESHYQVDNHQSLIERIDSYWNGLQQAMIEDYAERYPSWQVEQAYLVNELESGFEPEL